MINTKVFKSNQSQAVRLPKAVAFSEEIKEVSIAVVGNTRVISPILASWDAWFDLPQASDDFIESREQPSVQARESLDD